MKHNFIRHLAGAVLIVVAAGSMLVGCDNKQKGDTTMKFVNVEKVLVDAGLVKQEQDYLMAVNQQLQKGMQMAEKSYTSLPADKVEAARIADKNLLTKQWKAQQQAARNVVLNTLKKASDSYRIEKKIDVLMPTQTALSIDPELDVSADLIAKLKTEKLDFGKLPEITTKVSAKPAK
ncbi:MAG TPA: hypothetical protein VJY99_00570 [Buttiauxella sp.]|uniref:hypothetical protein n=1 Tax=Buttiauxella sp. TaxID=1972222 RepID=UPI002B480BBF|nr:hypothetical protein [Buttiauxella sp.]HKM95196.1 hypothetical protein [Buttiauxella sp.]